MAFSSVRQKFASSRLPGGDTETDSEYGDCFCVSVFFVLCAYCNDELFYYCIYIALFCYPAFWLQECK